MHGSFGKLWLGHLPTYTNICVITKKKPKANQVDSSRLGQAQFSLKRELEFAEYLAELKGANRINNGNLKSEVFHTIADKFSQTGCRFDLSQMKVKYNSLCSQTQEYNRIWFRVW